MEDGLFLMFESLKEVLSILTLYNAYIIHTLISQVPIAAYIHTPTVFLFFFILQITPDLPEVQNN